MDAAPSWSFRPDAVARQAPFGDRYTTFFGVVLLGYAVAGRGFAYVGYPPLFIGEVALALGLLALAVARRRTGVLGVGPLGLAAVFVAWVAIRAMMGAPTWGIDALRDGMVGVYGLFAIVGAGLVLERPERLRWLVARYRRVAWGLVIVGWPVYFLLTRVTVFPVWPGSGVPLIQTKAGDLLVHLAMATMYVVVGFQKPRPALLVGLVLGTIGLMVTSRGGMLGFVMGVSLATLWKPASARFGRFVYAGALLVVLGLAVGSSGIEANNGDREYSVDQIWTNIMSIAGKSDDAMLSGTAEWRMEWWKQILGYTFGGEHFLDGKGFGINLATDDGYSVDDAESLRSPHNSHLTVLARGGVPMFLTWLLIQGLWLLTVARAAFRARLLGLAGWQAFYAVCGAFWLAAHVNATFDVYLEGPMGGVWFWSVFGLALAGTRLQKAHPHLLDDLRVTSGPPPETPTWGWAPAADAPASPASSHHDPDPSPAPYAWS